MGFPATVRFCIVRRSAFGDYALRDDVLDGRLG
jgi:hypothetical protein